MNVENDDAGGVDLHEMTAEELREALEDEARELLNSLTVAAVNGLLSNPAVVPSLPQIARPGTTAEISPGLSRNYAPANEADSNEMIPAIAEAAVAIAVATCEKLAFRYVEADAVGQAIDEMMGDESPDSQ